MTRSAHQNGTTLVELVIAITVIAMAVTAVLGCCQRSRSVVLMRWSRRKLRRSQAPISTRRYRKLTGIRMCPLSAA
jgi:Tfp pilus assembly protein PilV